MPLPDLRVLLRPVRSVLRARRGRRAALPVATLGLLLATALAQVPAAFPTGASWPLVRFVLALVAVTATWRVLAWRARTAAAERLVWRMFSAGCFLYGVGAVATAACVAVPELRAFADVPGAVCAALTFPLAYRALVRWSRRSSGVDPDDLLNGTGAVLVVAAFVGAGVALRDGDGVTSGFFGSSSWPEQLLVLQNACVFVLLGAALTAAFTGRLHRDVRVWLVFAAYALAGSGGVAALVGDGVRPAWALPLWAAGLVALAAAAVLEARFEPTETSDPVKSTVGSFVVVTAGLAAATLVLLTAAPRGLALCALVGVLGSSVRLLVNLFELAQLAVSRREALTDDLTGTANRRALLRHLDDLLAERGAVGDRPARGVQVLVFDLDHFKEVNDSLGHSAGDGLLQMLTQRIAPELPPAAVLARLGGDEFVVVSDDGPAGERVLAVLEDARREPFAVGGVSVHADLSVGRTTWTPAAPGAAATDAALLLRRADSAMYDAKRTGQGTGSCVVTYDPVRHGDTQGLLTTVAELRHAVAAGQLRVHFQPQLHAGDGTLSGVEALVRWEHPSRGLLGPGEFLDLAETHGLMDAVTREVLRQAVSQQAAWRRRGLAVRVSVNLSAGTLLDASLPATVAALLDRHGVPASSLVLEVTETALLREPERSLAVVEALRALGVQGSIDDFGTGYSSLTQLRQLPVGELKLDRSFTADLLADPRAAAIVAHTIGLAHALQLRVVAEGVEDEDTLAALTGLGCDETQGFLHARPLPARAFEAWYAARYGAGARHEGFTAAKHGGNTGSDRLRAIPVE